jgi:GTP-binding protein EngB required for normal cell division/uncharacterized protein (DUF697 family)
MSWDNKMNILVLGSSGAGKSTLIKSISGAKVQTGVGEGNTQKISVYESDTWPMRFIDTKGIEYNWFEQRKTINQVKKFTKEQIKDSEGGVAIDAVWFCVEGTTRRIFADNISMMNKAIKGWKNVPVFAVITKSYSEPDIAENIDSIQAVFNKSKDVNLQKIIPVVAQAYRINNETVVPPQGISELCNATLECSSEAKKISKENRVRMILEQKRYSAQALIAGSATAGATVGAIPFKFADSKLLVPLETTMAKGLLKIYNIEFTADLVGALVGSAAVTTAAKAALAQLKNIPNLPAMIVTGVLNAVVAGFFVAALGESIIALCEAVVAGKIDITKIDQVTDFLSSKIKESDIFKAEDIFSTLSIVAFFSPRSSCPI